VLELRAEREHCHAEPILHTTILNPDPMPTPTMHPPSCRMYWALGGELRAEREHCHAELLEAAAEEGPQQAEAFEWLGHWYREVAGDELHARKCYQRALALDPTLVRGVGP
jgi:hypothetical protein